MSNKTVKNLTLTQKHNPEIMPIINALGIVENRPPTNSAKILIIEAGAIKLSYPKEYREFIENFKAKVPQSAGPTGT